MRRAMYRRLSSLRKAYSSSRLVVIERLTNQVIRRLDSLRYIFRKRNIMKNFNAKLAPAVVLIALLVAAPFSGASPQRVKGRALLVGIDQYADARVKRVRGAEEDARATGEFIKREFGFAEDDIHTLVGAAATRKRILAEFRDWLIGETKPGDRVFFLYSGHGSRLKDDNGDERDGFDETLAPYDAKPTGENQIRDGEINQLIEQLSGRSATLIFDSCHSGTITRGGGQSNKTASDVGPRYMPSPEQFARLQSGTRGGSGLLDYGVGALESDDQLGARDLSLVEEDLGESASGIVIISAAQANQQAYPLAVDGGYRGALSYVFNDVQRGRKLPLDQLEREVTERVAELQRSGRLKGFQRPSFEVFSRFPRNTLPLFAGPCEWLSTPANPNSAIKLSLRSREGKTQYRLKEDISYEVTTNAPGWLYLIVFSQENVANCIFPTGVNEDNRVEAGTHRLPRSNYFEASLPLGKDVALALLSSERLNLGDKEEMTWDEVFNRLRSKKLADFVRTRGNKTKKSGRALDETDWQAASLVIETVR